MKVIPGPDDAEQAVRDGDEHVVVADLAGLSKEVPIVALRPKSRWCRTDRDPHHAPMCSGYAGCWSAITARSGPCDLLDAGVSPAIASPLNLEELEVSSAQQRAAAILNFIPLFIVLAAFTAGMQIATDSTAGERERGSLEPLLVNPTPRGAIAAGKWLAATFAAMLGVLLTSGARDGNAAFHPDARVWRALPAWTTASDGLLGAVLPMCLLSTGIQTYLATFARSFKESQTYMGILILFPMLPGILSSVYPLDTKGWMYLVPILGQHVLAADALGAKDTPYGVSSRPRRQPWSCRSYCSGSRLAS